MKWIWWIWLLIPAMAQEVTLDVQPREIGINESVRFTITIQGDTKGRNPSFPHGFKDGDFELRSRAPSYSSSTQIINGNVSITQSYSYVLVPKVKGRLTFPSQTVQVLDQLYSSDPIEVIVGDPVTDVTSGGRNPYDSGFSRGRRNRTEENAEVFAVAETEKTSYYLGEPIEYKVKLYRTGNVVIYNQGSSVELPQFHDFWVEERENSTARENPTAVYNGKRYAETTVDHRILYPNKAGKITLDPARFVLTVSVGGGFFANRQQVERATEPVVLDIKPLPERNKPENFSGLVGNFEMLVEPDKNSLKVGETLSLKVTISGSGNFAAVKEPKPLNEDGRFEIFEGGEPNSETRGGITLSKTWVYALVPKNEGTYEVDLPTLSFFDPRTETYRSVQPESHQIQVLPGERLDGGRVTDGGNVQLSAEQNLAFIKTAIPDPFNAAAVPADPQLLVKVAGGFLVLDLLVFLGLFAGRRVGGFKSANRPRFALKTFKKKVAGLDTKSADFHGALAAAIFDYFGDRWEREGKGISLEMIHHELNRRGLAESLYQQLADVVESCRMAGFAGGTGASPESLRERAVKVVEQVEGALS